MSLEAATWITDLDVTNPLPTDQKKQGDDHIRMLKDVLKRSFPTASKAFYNPTAEAKTANFTVVATDMHKTFLVDTTAGAVTATLPTLVVGDAGWECTFLKTNTGTNALFVAPASGTIQSGDQAGLAKTRRCIPGAKSRVFWTGAAWIAERAVNVPVGTVLDIPRSGLAVGYEFAAGQTLTSASTNYPDFYQSNGNSGVVTDRRGRVAFGKDNMVSDAGRLTTGTGRIDGDTLGAVGGEEAHPLTEVENGPHAHGVTQTPHQHATTGTTSYAGVAIGNSTGGPTSTPVNPLDIAGLLTGAGSANISVNSSGSGTAHNNIPPGIVTNFMVVVE